MARLMILHGFYDKAYEWLAGQCFCKLEPAELMRLCSRLLAKESYLEEKRLMLLCAQAALTGKQQLNQELSVDFPDVDFKIFRRLQ